MAFNCITLLRVTAALASLAAVNAHGYIVSWTVGDGKHPGFDPSWDVSAKQPDTAQRHYFEPQRGFPDINSKDTACGARSDEFTSTIVQTWPVEAGKQVSVLWDQWPIAHKGPILQYMAACPSSGCDGVEAAGLPWFKISETGYDGKDWASDKLNSSGASWSFDIPAQLKGGKYLIRHEIIAMHFAGAPQVYPVCFQADVSSSGTFEPTNTVTFPEAYHSESISLQYETFNVNNSDTQKFTCPGPAIEDFSGASGGSVSADSSSATDGSATASSKGVESTASGQPEKSATADAGSGNASDAPVNQASEYPAASSTAAGGTMSSSVSANSFNASVPAQSSTHADGAHVASATGHGWGRHSRRPGQPRSCMAPKATST